MVLLCAAAAALSTRLDGYPLSLALAAVVFMALNALGAVYPLYLNRGRKNPFNVYIGGMVVRMAVIGASLIAVIVLTRLSKAALLSLTCTAMASFLAYLAVEIRHFMRNPSGLLAAGPGTR